MSTESRQTRRWRQRQNAKRWPTTCFVLMCRLEHPGGAGAWAISGVETPVEGDAVARVLQAGVAEIPGFVPARCELVENTDAALQRWGAASVKRRDALLQWRETGV